MTTIGDEEKHGSVERQHASRDWFALNLQAIGIMEARGDA